ncbi:unnamed protein product [Rhizophagus irregularis]|uniref:Uncharacterized protein n=1 Tax=Rhizophagus irregularis TaxID=588596 RepID=A0A915ZN08_9GLOM|nr:unnamed protein product [Rhizophagus irregularis]
MYNMSKWILLFSGQNKFLNPPIGSVVIQIWITCPAKNTGSIQGIVLLDFVRIKNLPFKSPVHRFIRQLLGIRRTVLYRQISDVQLWTSDINFSDSGDIGIFFCSL